MKKKLALIFAVSFAAVLGFSFVAAEPGNWYEPGSQSGREPTFQNIREGYQLFREKCKTCHNRGNEAAPFLCPESKTMKGWNRVFARENYAAEKAHCLEGYTQEELNDMNDYLYTHASDVTNPNDELECGI